MAKECKAELEHAAGDRKHDRKLENTEFFINKTHTNLKVIQYTISRNENKLNPRNSPK